jgi:translation initiation factor IF-1
VTPDFQIGDRVRLANAELEGVVISKSYGNVRFEVRCDNGHYVRELLPEDLSLIEKPTSS